MSNFICNFRNKGMIDLAVQFQLIIMSNSYSFCPTSSSSSSTSASLTVSVSMLRLLSSCVRLALVFAGR